MIDWIFIFIIFTALGLFFLGLSKKNRENFTNFPPKKLGVDYGATSPQQVGSQGLMPAGFSKWISGFSKFGPTPPRPRCNVTVLGENCTNLPEDTSTNKFAPTCQNSYNTYPANYKNKNLFVLGRSLGRTRQCRELI